MSKIIDKRSILTLFFGTHKELHIRAVARRCSISPMTASKYLKEYAQKELLTEVEVRGAIVYRANFENPRFRTEQRLHNLRLMEDSGLLDFLDEKLSYPTIILFGSWAKGENHDQSDLDLFVLSIDKKEPDVTKFQKQLGPIHILLYTSEDFQRLRKNNKELLNNIMNGVILRGFIEVFPSDSKNSSKQARSLKGTPTTKKRSR